LSLHLNEKVFSCDLKLVKAVSSVYRCGGGTVPNGGRKGIKDVTCVRGVNVVTERRTKEWQIHRETGHLTIRVTIKPVNQ